MEGADLPHTSRRIRSIIVDDQYKALAANLLHTGRGRPPSLPKGVWHDNRLLVQLDTLRCEGEKTWDDVRVFFQKLFPDIDNTEISPLVSRIYTATSTLSLLLAKQLSSPSCSTDSSSEEIQSFLNVTKDEPNLGPFSKRAGITRSALMTGNLSGSCGSLCNGLVAELINFATTQNLRESVIFGWCQQLTTDLPPVDRLKTLLKKTTTSIKTLRKNKSKPGGQSALQSYLETLFPHGKVTTTTQASKSNSNDHLNSGEHAHSVAMSMSNFKANMSNDNQELLNLQALCHKQTNQLKEKGNELEHERVITETLQRACRTKEATIRQLEIQAIENKTRIMELRTKNNILEAQVTTKTEQVTEKTAECKALKRSKLYVKLQQKERKIRTLTQRINQAAVLRPKLAQKMYKIKSLQKLLSTSRTRLAKRVSEKCDLQLELKEARRALPVVGEEKPNLKEGGKFCNNTVVCTAQLIGECDIAAETCGKVIQSVGRHIFNVDIVPEEVPSQRSALRFADAGQVMALMHIKEEMGRKRYDMHCDGTSRNGEKFTGHQITLEDQSTLSLGFQLVAREDAKSLLDLTLRMFEELEDLDPTEVNPVSTADLMRNMVGIMTDRAATMKLFQKEVEEKRKEILQSEEGLNRLYCNAHFLLGLSSAALKTLVTVEKENKWTKAVGRDCLPAFYRFSSAGEPAAVRIVRLVCDVIGPRGDEKNGCRDDWVAHCTDKNIACKLTSFKSNRFNNLFEAASAVLFHRGDILDFFNTVKGPCNLKQKSVVEDLQSKEVITMVACLAVMFIFVTGPFWRLVRSDTHYLDQGIHIQQMYGKLLEANDYSSMQELLTRSPSAIPAFPLQPTPVLDQVTTFISVLSATDSDALHGMCLAMFKSFTRVADLQLQDFLVGGKYSTVAEPEKRTEMQHSQLNNLFGEACLGDLDFSIFKRRHSSVHHHTTVNMLKRNKPIKNFLMKKSDTEQKRIIDYARKKSQHLRQSHRDQEKGVILERQLYLRTQQEKREQLSARKEMRKMNMLRQIHADGGLCFEKQQMIQLLSSKKTKTAKISALRLQMQYHRLIHGSKDKLLCSTKLALHDMVINLGTYLDNMAGLLPPLADFPPSQTLKHAPTPPMVEDEALPSTPSAASDSEHSEYESPIPTTSKRRKRSCAVKSKKRKIILQDTDKSDSDKDPDEDGCEFRQGMQVLVFYDNHYYVGEVLHTFPEDRDRASIAFMEQIPKQNIFRWGKEDFDNVERQFVMEWNLEMGSRNGRTWSILNFASAEAKYHEWKFTST